MYFVKANNSIFFPRNWKTSLSSCSLRILNLTRKPWSLGSRLSPSFTPISFPSWIKTRISSICWSHCTICIPHHIYNIFQTMYDQHKTVFIFLNKCYWFCIILILFINAFPNGFSRVDEPKIDVRENINLYQINYYKLYTHYFNRGFFKILQTKLSS